MTTHPFAIFCAAVFAFPLACFGQTATSLSEVKTVYVDDFGESEGADMIREKVVNRLFKTGRISVVERPEAADAILVGKGEVTKKVYYSANVDKEKGAASAGTQYDATLVVRLIGKDRRILWADEAKPGFLPDSVSSSVADRVCKNLVKAINKANKIK